MTLSTKRFILFAVFSVRIRITICIQIFRGCIQLFVFFSTLCDCIQLFVAFRALSNAKQEQIALERSARLNLDSRRGDLDDGADG